MPPPAPTLPEELLEEIFLRLPPDEPEWLVRASLASKLWLGLLHGPSFRRRYRELHGAPPMLGFLCRSIYDSGKKHSDTRFVSTGKFSARFPQDNCGYDAWDCRHGRVLLRNACWWEIMEYAVWDPMTGRHMELGTPKVYDSHGAAVLCAATGCDHIRVVVVGLQHTSDGGCVACVHTSLPQMEGWSKLCSHHIRAAGDVSVASMPPVLNEDALYFMILDGEDDDDNFYFDDGDDDDDIKILKGILKYDFVSNCLTLIDAPHSEITDGGTILMAMEDGCLGFARLNMFTLYLWSRQMGPNGVASWTACRVIDLEEFLPIQKPKKKFRLVGSVEGTDIIFVTTDLGIYEISLKSLQWKKIWNIADFYALVPYMSFYDP